MTSDMKHMTVMALCVDPENDKTYSLCTKATTADGKIFSVDLAIEEENSPFQVVGIDQLEDQEEVLELGRELLQDAFGTTMADRIAEGLARTRKTINDDPAVDYVFGAREIRTFIMSLLDCSGFEYARGAVILEKSFNPYSCLGRHDNAKELPPALMADETGMPWWVAEFEDFARNYSMATCKCRAHLGAGKWLEAEVSASIYYHVGDAFRSLLAPIGKGRGQPMWKLVCLELAPATHPDARKRGGGYVVHSVRWLYDTQETMDADLVRMKQMCRREKSTTHA
jgi:hypothetical protein